MNIIELVKQLWHFARQLIGFLLLRKTFNYVLQMSPQDCLQRLRGLSQPKICSMRRDVYLSLEERHYRFEVCAVYYGRNGDYEAIKAAGIVTPTIDKTGMSIISGTIRLRTYFLVYPLLLLAPIFLIVYRVDLFKSYFIFYVLWFVYVIFGWMRTYREYKRFESLILDTFIEAEKVTNEQP